VVRDRTVRVIRPMTDRGTMTVRDRRGRTYHLVAFGSEVVREGLTECRAGDEVRLRLHAASETTWVATSLFPDRGIDPAGN
jgi:hypothetical protein